MIDGIYTAYLSGQAGQGMAMFVFRDGSIAGADMIGLTFAGTYEVAEGRVTGNVDYSMPAESASLTGVTFERPSGLISVPIDLPEAIDPDETYRISTPIGPLNAKFHKNVSFE